MSELEYTLNDTIDPEQVIQMFGFCSIQCDDELMVKVEGTQHIELLSISLLQENSCVIMHWLNLLPRQFHKQGGGGWSFINACNLENGIQWTSFHHIMDQLFILGIGLGVVKCLVPKEMWHILPGGMPYYVIDLPI